MIPDRLFHLTPDAFAETWPKNLRLAYPEIIAAEGSRKDVPGDPWDAVDFVLCVALREGDYAEETALIFARMTDGRWFYADAWCDTTGWDCQSGGHVTVADSWDGLVQFGLDAEARETLPWVDFGAHVDDTLRARSILSDHPLVAVFARGNARRVVVGGAGPEVRIIETSAEDMAEDLAAFARAHPAQERAA